MLTHPPPPEHESPPSEVGDSFAPAHRDGDATAWRRALVVGMATFVVSRLCILAGAGVRAAQVWIDARTDGEPVRQSPRQLITGVFTQWDGNWYLAIVRHGYPAHVPDDITYFQLQARTAFFPAYPMLVRAVDVVLPGGDVLAALFTNMVLSVLCVVGVGLLARRLFDVDVAQRAMVLFAVFPGAVVLSYAYSEALLIALVLACFLCLLDERWLLAGLAAAAATAARPNGVAVVAACAVAAFLAIRARRQWRALVAVALAPVGFVAFQLFLWAHTGEPTVWFRVQNEAWKEGTSYGATALKNTFRFILHPFESPAAALTAASLVALGFGLWCMWRRRLPWPMVAYVAVVTVLMLMPATVTARPRFVFTAFPIFIAVAAWWPENRRTEWDLVLVSSGAGLTALAALYGVFGAIP